MKLHILAEAEQEIESARSYLNEQSPALGSRFLDDLESTLTSILDRPLSFAKVETLPDLTVSTRFIEAIPVRRRI